MSTIKAAPRVFRSAEASFQPRFAYGHMAEAAQAVGPEDGTELAAGFVRLKQARIPWTIRYDEVIFVVDGSMVVETEGADLEVKAGEMIWLPAGTKLQYVAEDCTCFYAVHPGNWAEGLDLSTLGQ